MPPRSRLAWIWTLVILALCWLPGGYMPVNERTPKPLLVPNLDKAVHLVIFALFSFLWMRVGSSRFRGWWVVVAGIALAVITEVGQETRFVSRDGNAADALADSVGVVVGVVAFEVVRRFQERRTVRAGA